MRGTDVDGAIITLLTNRGRVRVGDLPELLGVSPKAVQRALHRLSESMEVAREYRSGSPGGEHYVVLTPPWARTL